MFRLFVVVFVVGGNVIFFLVVHQYYYYYHCCDYEYDNQLCSYVNLSKVSKSSQESVSYPHLSSLPSPPKKGEEGGGGGEGAPMKREEVSRTKRNGLTARGEVGKGEREIEKFWSLYDG